MTVSYEHYKALKISRPGDRILQVMMSNPGRLNSLDHDGHRELAEIWLDIDKDPDVNCVLLRGEGGAFSAGGDLDLVEDIADNWEVRARVWKEAQDLIYNVINCSKPIVSALEGPAVGAGLSAALVSDIIIAGRTTRIIDGHTRLGVAAGDHSAIVWPLLCGMAKSKYYLLLCETVTGEEAERIGLVSLCTEDDMVIDKAMEVCEKLAGGAQTAIRFTKRALNNWLKMAGPTFDTSLALEFLNFTGPDVREGVAALKEKRRPNFDPQSPI